MIRGQLLHDPEPVTTFKWALPNKALGLRQIGPGQCDGCEFRDRLPRLRRDRYGLTCRLGLLLKLLFLGAIPLPAAEETEGDDRDDHYGRETLPPPRAKEREHPSTVRATDRCASGEALLPNDVVVAWNYDHAFDGGPGGR